MVDSLTDFRAYLEQYYKQFPELFPEGFEEGFRFHEKRQSKKIEGLFIRRIKLKNGKVYDIIPSSVMPYMSGQTKEVSKGLLLRKWGVPYEVIAELFGRDAMYWERLEMGLGRMSIVGSVCKTAEIPVHLAADEKISFWNGEEVYIAMTAGRDCVLGTELSLSEDTKGLQEAYSVFKEEALENEPDYTPESVNLDGWKASNNAWKGLFHNITIVLCFLHAFLKIRDTAKGLKEKFNQVCKELWAVYRNETKDTFLAAMIALKQWAGLELKGHDRVIGKIEDLVAKADRFAVAYEHEACYRTSNQIDRPMNQLDRYLYQIRYFKGHRESANLKLRAWAMMYNFTPFSKRVQQRETNPKKTSRFEQINGFVYHEDWLQNCLIAGASSRKRSHHKKR